MQRIQKILSNCGYCSRRNAQELIKAARVTVNGKAASLGDKAQETDKIYVDGELVKKQERAYLMLNKPLGCVTALKDKRYKTVMAYLDVEMRVFPVGRLDYNTSGLLLFTNDGDFANNVMHPRYEVTKTYLVEVDKPIDRADIASITSGVNLEDGRTHPAKIKKHSPMLLEVVIHEGKKRIIRRIFKKLGYKVKDLKRIRVGSLDIGSLKPGKYRALTEKDRQKIFA